MFVVNPMPQQIAPALIRKMEQVETATVGHFLHSGFMTRELRAVLPEKRIAGTAVTVRLPHADSTILHYLTKLVRPGDFIVVDRCGDDKHACWGGVVTHSMKLGGIVGAVIDGPATDFSEIRRVDLPMWCRGPSPITTKILGLEGAINVPVSVGGQTVNPGDAIIADESGVLVLEPSRAEWAVDKAIGMQESELILLERLRSGEKLPDISGATKIVEASAA
ncbi:MULTISPECIES: RraA family protein [unclassified Shinella]|jgi:regulator of RNase E activity RraA|uniref:RraA family protein n=1 Tax=unclassified Shinella TaxID=2643062 RepID=UPI0003C538ED|nr:MULTISPECIES: RraA family protein [unclassified Shinella]EYR81124.1 dimethylmenaquinone methyltransferase [Shinella sp. DD12]KNY14134.1 4-hydroxy-4-methyl-2-oxoglutarate aldolase [Shinella sp. SUS2]KOC74054.1 4-hydroxy-4-methyl-2-oxoglutarate aldolase [Shinella sp. GWS1]MCO5151788.1 RraA family protein [Shinella sp.]MDC7265389.1 RraA family protein [Shinella sp. HY16]